MLLQCTALWVDVLKCTYWRFFCRVSLRFLSEGHAFLDVWVWTLCIYVACMSPALNGSSAIRCFKGSDVIEIRDRITFDFYTGLPHIYCDRLRGDNGCNCAIVFLALVEASPFPTNDFVVVHCPIHITWESKTGLFEFLFDTILFSLTPALAAIAHNQLAVNVRTTPWGNGRLAWWCYVRVWV